MKNRIIKSLLGMIVLGLSFYNMPLDAVTAFPKKVKVLLPSNDSTYIYIRGDEHCKFAYSQEGYTLLSDSSGWIYAKSSAEGYAVPSSFRLVSKKNENDSLYKFLKTIRKQIPIQKKQTMKKSEANTMYRDIAHGSDIGTRKALVILMQFPDKKFTKKTEDFKKLFNDTGYNDDGAKGSVCDYYRYVSYGKLNFVSDVWGPYTSRNQMNYYGGNTSDGSDSNPEALFEEAIEDLPDTVDLSKYDSDKDGYIDNVHIVFAGYGEEAGASSSAIWSHEATFSSPLTIRGIRISGYSCSPELRLNYGQGISRIGVICHELGHTLGANDYYDVDYSSNGSYLGTGEWDIMASGSWNDEGVSPANFNPYVKVHDFGWCSDSLITKISNICLLPSSTYNKYIRINTPVDGEYYLLENRIKYSFDDYVPGSGLMIYHVHKALDEYKITNMINNTSPQLLYPVCASATDKTPLSSLNYGNINSDGCPFPGSSGNQEFSLKSSPAAFCWNGDDPAFAITSIRQSNNNIYMNVSTSSSPGDVTGDDNVVYTEGFENGIDDFLLINGNTSKTWTVYPKPYTLITNKDLIPSPYKGKSELMLYDGLETKFTNSSIISPCISINSDSVYQFLLTYQSLMLPYGSKPELDVFLNDNNGTWQKCASVNDTTSQWKELKIQIPAGIRQLRYKFSGNIFTGGIFLDNIKIINLSSPAATINNTINTNKSLTIKIIGNGYVNISDNKDTNISIFNSYGILQRKLEVNMIGMTIWLKPGVYIIANGRGEIQKISVL